MTGSVLPIERHHVEWEQRCRPMQVGVLLLAACATAGCVRVAPGFEVPSAWPRIGVAHGSIRVPDEMVVGPKDSSMALCLDGICGFEYAPAAGEEAWRHDFREACGHQESPRCDLRASGLERSTPAVGAELIFGWREPDRELFPAWLALRGHDSLARFHDLAELSDPVEVRSLRANMLGLATAWREGEADCRPGHFVTASSSFADTPSIGDRFDLHLTSVDGRRTVHVDVRWASERDPEAHLRRYVRRDRIAQVVFVRMLGGAPLVRGREERRKLRRMIREEPRRAYRRIFRTRGRTVAGLRGDEIVLVPEEGRHTAPILIMSWAFAGRPGDPASPAVLVSMTLPYEPDAVPQALAQWDAMLETFRPLRAATHSACTRLRREQ
jgi:hypothetical protein